MDSNNRYVIREYDVKQYVFEKEYKFKKIYVEVYDLYIGDTRYTKFYCRKYFEDCITLVNASNEQITTEVDNFFRNVVELIDEKSLVKKIKSLFR